ncbi:MAG TPA: DUF4252 domain-containing protein [Puia sp.]|nr:DUF4252 domain-containing protein [Puia sp.]
MKKIIPPLMALFITVACHAQESHLDQFYQKFDAGGAETAKGSINMALMLNFSSSDTGDSWTKRITMCRFLTIDPEKTAKAGQEWAELKQSLKDDQFEEWMSVRKGKSNFKVMSKNRKDGQEDVVCVAVDEHGEGVFLQLRGRFTAADKARIQAAMQDREG